MDSRKEPRRLTSITLRSLQDFFIRYQLAAVEGVAEVASVGGFVRQYRVAVDSGKMRQAGVNLREVMDALSNSNLNVGGKVIEESGMEFVVRGIGLVNSLDDLRRIAVRTTGGLPIYLEDIAEITMGGDFRRGALDEDGNEVVGGVVVMRTGENAMRVIERVKDKIARVSPSLPAGVSIEPFYDRSSLIDRTIETLRHALIEEIILVITRSHHLPLALPQHSDRVTIPLPVSILISFILMRTRSAFVECHVPGRHRHCHRRARGCGDRHDRKCRSTPCEEAERKKGTRLTAEETLDVTRAAAHPGRAVRSSCDGHRHSGLCPSSLCPVRRRKLFILWLTPRRLR